MYPLPVVVLGSIGPRTNQCAEMETCPQPTGISQQSTGDTSRTHFHSLHKISTFNQARYGPRSTLESLALHVQIHAVPTHSLGDVLFRRVA